MLNLLVINNVGWAQYTNSNLPAKLAVLSALRNLFDGDGRLPDGFDPIRSRVLLMDGKIGAMILIVSGPGVIFIAARIVAPEYRGGTLNQRLFAAAHASAPVPPGCRLRFETHDRHYGTARFACHLGASPIKTRVKLRSNRSDGNERRLEFAGNNPRH